MANPTRPEQQRYFSELYRRHKGSPMAVSSESLAHKALRFSRLAEILPRDESCSVHDVGMGMGHFLEFIREDPALSKVEYSGTDVVPEYVAYCDERFPELSFSCRDLAEGVGPDVYDFVVMSGVFHQMRHASRSEWERFAFTLIENCFSMARVGVAFNFVTCFVDYYQAGIYYCNIGKMLEFISDQLSRFFVVDHAYALYELTVFVYHENPIRSQFPQEEFAKYFKGDEPI